MYSLDNQAREWNVYVYKILSTDIKNKELMMIRKSSEM